MYSLEDYECKKSGRGYKVKMICKQCGVEYWKPWNVVQKGEGIYCSKECATNALYYSDDGLDEYEHRVGENRHVEVRINCEQCGNSAWVKWQRVKVGQGRFCSRNCANASQRKWGRRHVYFYFDKIKGRWMARWREKKTGNTRVCHKAKFLWEDRYGDIPDGYEMHHKDKDKMNDNLDNLELVEGAMHRRDIHGSDRKVVSGTVHKQCYRCKDFYPEGEFTQTYCRSCYIEYMREWRLSKT